MHRRSRSGFTLIELMVVVILMAILAAAIIPEMKGTYENALLRSTGRTLVDAFALAYSRAVSLRQPHRVRIDRVEGRYLLERSVLGDGEGTEFVPLRGVPGSAGPLDRRIQVRVRSSAGADPGASRDSGMPGREAAPDHPDAIEFYPDGTADASEVTLQDRDGFRLVLKVNPVTARVQIEEAGRE